MSIERTRSVGQPLIHDSARGHVAGTAVYIDDLTPREGQLHACVGGSAITRGRVKSMNLDPLRAAPGVVDVITAADVPGKLDIGPVFPGDPLLVAGEIEFRGQPLFAVLATSHDLARRAVALAKIEYEEMEPMLDLARAITDAYYVRPPHRMQWGDAGAVLNKASRRFQGELRVGGQEHFYLEGQVSLAIPEEEGGMTIYTSSQNPTEAQKLAAEVLGISMHKVNVITRRMGGGFGGKETHGSPWSCIAAVFARRNGCAVSCRLSRRDDMVMTGKRHNFLNHYDVCHNGEGRLEAIRYRLAGQCGNSPDLSDAIVDRAMFHCDNAYYIPDVLVDGLRCKTHTVSATAFRGFGGPQGMIAIEAIMDEIAFRVGRDPLDVRRTNLYNTTDRNVTPYHQRIDVFSVPRILDQLEAESDYRVRREAIRAFNRRSPALKKGIALTPVKFGISFTVLHLNQAGALVHVYTDGSIHLNHGGAEMGQGLMTKIRQVVAEEFQVNPDRIVVSATRTDKVPNTSATAASSGTDINGMAALNAARTIRRRMVSFLAEKYGVDELEVVFLDDRVHVGGRTLEFGQAAKESWLGRVSLSATGFYCTPKIHYDRTKASGRPFFYYANGAAVSEVVIDTLTGESRLLRVDILHDVGRSINPAIDIGQIEGGYIQGFGWLTCEELKWDRDGRLLSDGPATYKIPAISDTPPIFNTRLLADADNSEETIFRSKAVGEPPLMLAISAWCAIRDAVAAVGDYGVFPELHAPATPEEILRAVDGVRGRSS